MSFNPLTPPPAGTEDDDRMAVLAVWMARLHTPEPMTRADLQVMRDSIESQNWQEPFWPLHRAVCAALEPNARQQEQLLAVIAPPYNRITRDVFAVLQARLSQG